ncbi:unnamed protein product [Prorocentrum cordatum]|uniref:Uncharacterized protein n=1 Tax=Prorocentrum cordatum TaxID=2364126 RepID=A0ABN9Y4M4_9DINO|nr:unnamed protein product [Polarella glacialis]
MCHLPLVAQQTAPALVVADAPCGAVLGEGAALEARGCTVTRRPIFAAEFGDRVAKNRAVVIGAPDREGTARFLEALADRSQPVAEALAPCLPPPEATGGAAWRGRAEGAQHDDRIATTGELRSADQAGAKGRLVREPAATPRAIEDELAGYGGRLICDDMGDGKGARILEPPRVWQLAGGSVQGWRTAIDAGIGVEDLARAAARRLPQGAAGAQLEAAAQALDGAGLREARAGVGLDAEKDIMRGALGAWLQAWARAGAARPSVPVLA